MKKKGRKSDKRVYGLIIRYAIAVLLSINSLFIFYYIFKPLTFFPAVSILKIIYPAKAFGIERLIIQGKEIVFINSCVAASAYYLFAVLNLTTFGIGFKKRIKIFVINSVALLIMNIIRIIILAVVLVNISSIFDATHFIFWNFLGTIFVVGIWILTAKIYKIKYIPVFSDIIFIKNQIKRN